CLWVKVTVVYTRSQTTQTHLWIHTTVIGDGEDILSGYIHSCVFEILCSFEVEPISKGRIVQAKERSVFQESARCDQWCLKNSFGNSILGDIGHIRLLQSG